MRTNPVKPTWLAGAREAVDHVSTDAIIYTGVALTFIYISLTVSPRVAWKTEVQTEITHFFVVAADLPYSHCAWVC